MAHGNVDWTEESLRKAMYCEALEIRREEDEITEDLIKNKYRAKVKAHKSDAAMMTKLNLAKSCLNDPSLRSEYFVACDSF